MPTGKYKVFLNGRNFRVRIEDKEQRLGFYTTRFVEAGDPEEAENLAVQLIREDDTLRFTVLNERSDPPMIYAEEITEVQSFEGVLAPGTGYTFYTETSTEDNGNSDHP